MRLSSPLVCAHIRGAPATPVLTAAVVIPPPQTVGDDEVPPLKRVNACVLAPLSDDGDHTDDVPPLVRANACFLAPLSDDDDHTDDVPARGDACVLLPPPGDGAVSPPSRKRAYDDDAVVVVRGGASSSSAYADGDDDVVVVMRGGGASSSSSSSSAAVSSSDAARPRARPARPILRRVRTVIDMTLDDEVDVVQYVQPHAIDRSRRVRFQDQEALVACDALVMLAAVACN